MVRGVFPVVTVVDDAPRNDLRVLRRDEDVVDARRSGGRRRDVFVAVVGGPVSVGLGRTADVAVGKDA